MATFHNIETVVAILLVLLAAAVGGFYLFRSSRLAETSGFFVQRPRRLGFTERVHLDGGRKLLLIRRDEVEHLVMIGGPIDIVVESGIRGASAPEVTPRVNGVARAGWTSAFDRLLRRDDPPPLGVRAAEPITEPELSFRGGKRQAGETLDPVPAEEPKPL
jgi:hypothetical protein